MNFHTWLTSAVARLHQSESPKRDAEILLAWVTGKARSFIIAFGETELTQPQYSRLETLLNRRIAGEPIAYITGEREFWSLSLKVSPDTLIPRPDTECLIEYALTCLPVTPCAMLDLGTGTGAIALALASERQDCEVTAIDIIPEAVELARSNAKNLRVHNVKVLQSDWFGVLNNQQYTLIISNPPYIDKDDPHLNQGDVRFEPSSALVADSHGLACLNRVINEARKFLVPGGRLVLEHGWQQGLIVRELLNDAGFSDVETRQDYGGNDRFSTGRYC